MQNLKYYLYLLADKKLQREIKSLKTAIKAQDKVIVYRLREFERLENEYHQLRAKLLTECSEINDALADPGLDTLQKNFIRLQIKELVALLLPNAAKPLGIEL